MIGVLKTCFLKVFVVCQYHYHKSVLGDTICATEIEWIILHVLLNLESLGTKAKQLDEARTTFRNVHT